MAQLLLLKRRLLAPPMWHINLWPLLLPAALFALWQLAAQYQWMPEQILPAPRMVLATASALWQGDLLAQWWVSLQRLALGLLLGVLAGTLLGGLFGLSRRSAQYLEPLFYTLAQIPTLGWIPLFMVLFGIDDGLKMAVIVKAVIVPVTLNTQQALAAVPLGLSEVAHVVRLNGWQRFRLLLVPASLPGWFTGVHLALSQAWISLIVVELLASSQGIGYLMVWGRQLFQLDIVFVAIAVIGISGLVMEWGTHRLYQRLVFWPQPALSRQLHRRQARLAGIVLPVLLVALWQLASRHAWIDPLLLSSPLAVVERLISGLQNGELLQAMGQSLGRALLGGAAGIVLGFAGGLACALRPTVGAVFSPTLNVLRQIALFAWLPLLTAWVGNDNPGKVVFVMLAAFFPMFFSTLKAVAQRDPQLDEVAKVLRLKGADYLRLLILPGAAPGIFAGLRLALLYAWLGNIGAEYFMSSGVGIGSLMINAQQLLDMPTIFCGMLLIGITGALLDKTGRVLEASATRWRRQEQI
ncbi:sulfonate transport system permease protein [Gibbsiella quercinecans]|uniref:ABC transporter permease n=1 Tax=Gibbsiella quercinecans TaxID=929813 RepID=A0A250B809_9GAMM|nr:ABC transporter permease [Gibbsiella quercinecans]ATA22370.1 ABC transporter permease [Gibbsiella quercinecans]RLM03724.1 ABC transporter permease [Gibbsiella quercinecans]RLM11113.1 ABC transporter permease [Gibbsiella quercinecans]TCT87668.1 sulfonate transport system permease protein [Gibbsiella quercinecans]